MRKCVSFFLCLFLLLACTNPTADNSAAPEPPDTEEESGTENFSTAFPGVFQYFTQQDPSFTAARFDQAQEDTLEAPARPLNEKEVQPFYPYLIYNRDSTQAIDLYSYNVILTNRNGRIAGAAAGPDTEVALLNFPSNTRKRLLFGGPSLAVLDAAWLNDQTVAIVGAEVIRAEQLIPMIWTVDVSGNKRETFIYSDTLTASLADYKDRRLSVR